MLQENMMTWTSMHSPNIPTTPLRQWGFWQCFSWTTLRDKHCQHPIAVMGVLDTFVLSLLICNHFSRKVVLEKWFCKLGFFFWSTTFLEPEKNRVCRTTFLQPEKRWIYSINPPFFLGLQPENISHFAESLFSNLKKICTFLEPLF